MQTYEPLAGTHIGNACKEAVALAVNSGGAVRFSFNGIALQALPTDQPETIQNRWQSIHDAQQEAYQNSPEGRAAAAERERQVTMRQAALDGLVAKLPALLEKQNLDEVVGWVRDLVEPSDDVATKFNARGVAEQLERAGYIENDHVGMPPEWFCTRERMGRYIIGQAINCLRMGRGPHPMAAIFAEKYFNLRPAPQSQPQE